MNNAIIIIKFFPVKFLTIISSNSFDSFVKLNFDEINKTQQNTSSFAFISH